MNEILNYCCYLLRLNPKVSTCKSIRIRQLSGLLYVGTEVGEDEVAWEAGDPHQLEAGLPEFVRWYMFIIFMVEGVGLGRVWDFLGVAKRLLMLVLLDFQADFAKPPRNLKFIY